jgi:hypothetical protein
VVASEGARDEEIRPSERRRLGPALLAFGVGTHGNCGRPTRSWSNQRVLDCERTKVETYLTPAGFGSAFHVVGSAEVIKAMHVEVVFPGTTEPVTTFDRN